MLKWIAPNKRASLFNLNRKFSADFTLGIPGLAEKNAHFNWTLHGMVPIHSLWLTPLKRSWSALIFKCLNYFYLDVKHWRCFDKKFAQRNAFFHYPKLSNARDEENLFFMNWRRNELFAGIKMATVSFPIWAQSTNLHTCGRITRALHSASCNKK